MQKNVWDHVWLFVRALTFNRIFVTLYELTLSIEGDQTTSQPGLQEAFGLSLNPYSLNIVVGYKTRLAVLNWCNQKFR